jgi:hypothetical protein
MVPASRGHSLAAVALCLAGCISPSVVESSGRAVAEPTAHLELRPATAAELEGLWESTAIEGEAAASLACVLYLFSADGAYTGAALVLDERPTFQTLSGAWSLDEGSLDLGDGNVTRARIAGDRLELSSEGGAVWLRRVTPH